MTVTELPPCPAFLCGKPVYYESQLREYGAACAAAEREACAQIVDDFVIRYATQRAWVVFPLQDLEAAIRARGV